MAAYPQITTYPPLEKLSAIPGEQDEITFTFNIKWTKIRERFAFQIHLCVADISSHKHPAVWPSFPLNELDSGRSPYELKIDPELHTASFTTTQSRKSLAAAVDSTHLKFAYKYRFTDTMTWQWSQGAPSAEVREGEVLMQAALSQTPSIESLIELRKGWEAEALQTTLRDDRAVLLELRTSPLPASNTITRRVLGKVRHLVRFLAVSHVEPPWIGPRHGRGFLYLTEPALLCSVLRKDGNVVTIAAPSLENIYAILETDDDESLVVAARADKSTDQPLSVFVSVADNIETSIEMIMTHVRAETNKSYLVRDLLKDDPRSHNHSSSHLNGLLDGLGFCTWNAMGADINSEKIMGSLRLLRENDIKISTFLIDDGWQDVGPTDYDYSNPHRRGLAHYNAHRDKFPEGLGDLVKKIKSENPEISEIGVWHALLGYWGTFARQGHINDTYETRDIEGKLFYSEPATLKVVSSKDVLRFYDDFYASLSASGVTFVKTDVQYIVKDFADSADRADLISAYQAAWTTACQDRLGGKAISCMSQAPEILWRVLLQDKSAPVILRNSDDYFAEVCSSHAWHIWSNAHNAFFTQHLNAVLDWDIFQTSHEFALMHTVSRCLSGGPVIITDVPGDHDIELIKQMVVETPDAKTIVLRPGLKAKASHAFDSFTSGSLKVTNETEEGTKLLGVFNVGEARMSTLVNVAELASIGENPWREGSEVIVFSHRTQKASGPITLGTTFPTKSSSEMLLRVDLDPRECDVLSGVLLSRLQDCRPNGEGDVLVGVLGLMGKIIGAAAITSFHVSNEQKSKVCITIKLKALGELGIWIAGADLTYPRVVVDMWAPSNTSNFSHRLIQDEVCIHEVSTERGGAQIVTLDTARAWSRIAPGRQKSRCVKVKVTATLGSFQG